jgi:hypothetical protein
MEDSHSSTDAMGATTPDAPTSTGTPPKRQGPVDQTMDVAKKLLAMITGRAKRQAGGVPGRAKR